MAKSKRISPYAFDLDASEINAERGKARELRSSQWWKRRCAKGQCHWCGAYVGSER